MMIGTAVLWALLTLAPEADLQQRIDRADAAVSEGRWLDAAADYQIVFEATGDLRVRYAQAEALRLGGECARALPMYEEYLAGTPSQANQARTAQLIRYCEEELEAERAREAAIAAPVLPPAAPEPIVDDLPEPPPPRPWYRDPAGDALAAIGLATAVAGGVVLGLGMREGRTGGDANTDAALGDAIDRAETRTLAGGITLGVGSALLLGGIVRWVVVDRRNRIDVALVPRGLVVSGPLPSLGDLRH